MISPPRPEDHPRPERTGRRIDLLATIGPPPPRHYPGDERRASPGSSVPRMAGHRPGPARRPSGPHY
jgi:hypothetical protein